METQNQDAGIGIKILSFLLCPIGLYLYFANKDSAPRYARSCLILSLISLAILFVLAIIFSPMG